MRRGKGRRFLTHSLQKPAKRCGTPLLLMVGENEIGVYEFNRVFL